MTVTFGKARAEMFESVTPLFYTADTSIAKSKGLSSSHLYWFKIYKPYLLYSGFIHPQTTPLVFFY